MHKGGHSCCLYNSPDISPSIFSLTDKNFKGEKWDKKFAQNRKQIADKRRNLQFFGIG